MTIEADLATKAAVLADGLYRHNFIFVLYHLSGMQSARNVICGNAIAADRSLLIRPSGGRTSTIWLHPLQDQGRVRTTETEAIGHGRPDAGIVDPFRDQRHAFGRRVHVNDIY